MTSRTTRSKAFPAELRERAVRLVREQEAEHATRAAAIRSVAAADSDEVGHPFRSEVGRRSDLKSAGLPI